MNDEKFIFIDVNLTRGLAVVLVVGLLAITLMGYLAFGYEETAASSPQSPAVNTAGMRQFYLSTGERYGADADTGCAAGYHFASLWEIMDPSNLIYNTSLGKTQPDSGEGPPSGIGGWIRTGYVASANSRDPGRDNCLNWCCSYNDYYGTYAALEANWTAEAEMGVWYFTTVSCGTADYSVWCVED